MRENNRRFQGLIIFLLFGLMNCYPAYPTSSELNLGVSYYGSYSNNIFMNASKVKDYISQLQADLFLSLKRFNLYLDASIDFFTDNPEFNSFNIEPGIEYLHPLKGRNALYLDISYRILNYKDIYTDFNTSGPFIQAGVKLYTSPQTLLQVGGSFQLRNYVNFESFDFSNYNACLEFNRFFKTQTTLSLQTGYNYRYYPHIVDSYDFGDNYNYYGNKGSYGKGMGKKQHQHSAPNMQYNTMAISNVYGLLEINQSIGTRMGITGVMEIRENLHDFNHYSAETLIKNAYILYPFNDDYLWNGTRLTMQFKIVLFNRFAVSFEGKFSYFNKKYPGIYIMDEEGNPIDPLVERNDSLWLYMFKIAKKIGKLELFSDLFYRNNQSNDDYFFYKMLTISAGIGYYF